MAWIPYAIATNVRGLDLGKASDPYPGTSTRGRLGGPVPSVGSASQLAVRLRSVEDNFPARFENWRRWCIRKELYQGRAGSAEGNYRSPQIWDAPGPRPPPIYDADAVVLNRAFSQLGHKVRQTIKILTFRTHWRPQWQAQKLGVHYMRLGEELRKAKKMMENRLNFLE